MSENIQINASAPVVFNLVNNLKKTELWNAWTIGDTTNVAEYNEVSDGVGATSSWSGKINGSGTQRITASERNKLVRSELKFQGWDGVNYSTIHLEHSSEKVDVTWDFQSTPMPFLFRGMAVVMRMRSEMTRMYKEGLQNLKKLAEERANDQIYYGYHINSEIEWPATVYVMTRQVVPMEDIQLFFSSNIGSLFSRIQEAGIDMAGNPRTLFFNVDEARGQASIAVAIPVTQDVSLPGTIHFEMPSRPVISCDHRGDTQLKSLAHQALREFAMDRDLLLDYPIIEEYITEEKGVFDSSRMITRITYFYTSQN